MTATQRRARDRRHRHELIVRTARDLAEAEGWDAVTTRRLADRVEYSQPVLYSHFENKDAIVRAVAIGGFADLAAELRAARLAAPSREAAARAVAQAYLDFAAAHPALYEAMFTLPIDVRFASPGQTPQPLQDGFAQLAAVFGPRPSATEEEAAGTQQVTGKEQVTGTQQAAGMGAATGPADAGILAEVLWSSLHGLVTLTSRGRLPAEHQPARLDLLLARLAGVQPPAPGLPAPSPPSPSPPAP
jgi:AcrR family transcriptional regulator